MLQRPAPESDLFAVDRLSDFGLSDSGLSGEQLLARNPRTGGELVMPGEHFNTLVNCCSVFRSLDEHVAELMEGSDGAPQRAAAIRQVLQSFRDAGLTLAAADICRELAPVAGATPIAERPVVAIITCDRPQALERLLASMLENCDLGAVERCFVIDDSRSAEHGERNRAATQAATERSAAPIHYFGADAAAKLLKSLVAQLPQQEEAIRFLLDRRRWRDYESFGVARNFSHLLTVGRPLVVFDDDTLCEAFQAPFHAEGVTFSAGQREVTIYTTYEEWRQGLSRAGHDPVAGHLQCLGLALPEALGVLGLRTLQQEALRPAPLDLARRLRRGSRVLITEAGALGDPGTGSNTWLAMVPQASRERLARTDGHLKLALEQRCCWLGRERPTFRPQGKISQVAGFDNRSFLPPYFPVTRGEDDLFGQMTRYVYPDSVALDYPWAVPHLPLRARSWTAHDNSFAISANFPGFLVNGLVGTGDACLAVDTQDRVRFLGRLFEDFGAAPDLTLLDRLADDRHRCRASHIRKLQKQIEESAGLPAEWLGYLQEAMRQAQSSQLRDLRVENLKGAVGGLQGQELLDFWKGAWREFGRAMPAWSDIREAAAGIVGESFPG